MGAIRAIAFDLYGTLLSSPPRTLHRAIPKTLEIHPRAWLSLVRDALLLRPFANAEELAHFICEELAPEYGGEREAECVEIIREQLSHVEPLPGVLSLLSFLRRRGYALGLLSNLSSSYQEPFEGFGLAKLFDATFFSCDEGKTKPDPACYRELCARLGCRIEETLFVGDSLKNDVEGPASIGMPALRVGGESEQWVAETHLLGLMDLEETSLRPLVREGQTVEMPAGPSRILTIAPVSDEEQGRYNLVYRLETDHVAEKVVYVKRFLLPESAHVEELAYRVHSLVGLSTCSVSILGQGEPLLVISAARGEKYGGEMDSAIAWEIGRQFAFAFIFSNADIRPRNAFLCFEGGRPAITMVDLEHCFFNLAIDTSDVDDAFDPACLDREPELKVKKEVLTDRAMRRARRSFVREENVDERIYSAYEDGFRDAFHHMSSLATAIVDLLDERIHRRPYLALGTHSYRRAMASIDVRGIADRLRHDPDQVMTRFC